MLRLLRRLCLLSLRLRPVRPCWCGGPVSLRRWLPAVYVGRRSILLLLLLLLLLGILLLLLLLLLLGRVLLLFLLLLLSVLLLLLLLLPLSIQLLLLLLLLLSGVLLLLLLLLPLGIQLLPLLLLLLSILLLLLLLLLGGVLLLLPLLSRRDIRPPGHRGLRHIRLLHTLSFSADHRLNSLDLAHVYDANRSCPGRRILAQLLDPFRWKRAAGILTQYGLLPVEGYRCRRRRSASYDGPAQHSGGRTWGAWRLCCPRTENTEPLRCNLWSRGHAG